MTAYIKTLLAEYLALCDAMASGQHDAAEQERLSADRQWTHNTLIRLLGPDYDRPFDMKAFARSVIGQ